MSTTTTPTTPRLFSVDIEDMLVGSEQDPGKELLSDLVSLCAEKNATDIHLKPNCKCMVRISGKLVTVLDTLITQDFFDSLRQTLKFKSNISENLVYRFGSQQVRTQYFSHDMGEHLILRLQPLYAPALDKILGAESPLIETLRNPAGLILVTGPIGSGKTTIAAAIAQYWATQGRHVFSMEDPIEYLLKADAGMITQVNTCMTDQDGRGMKLDTAVTTALRSDVDAVFFGEIRTPHALARALEFASAREPVVATFHAGSISDALVRAVSMGTKALDGPTAKLAISQAMHTVLSTNLAFNTKNVPVPVVTSLPFLEPRVRKLVGEFEPTELGEKVEKILRDGTTSHGYISRELAVATAVELGAIEELAQNALPDDVKVTDY